MREKLPPRVSVVTVVFERSRTPAIVRASFEGHGLAASTRARGKREEAREAVRIARYATALVRDDAPLPVVGWARGAERGTYYVVVAL
jgi:hypothetical protein